MRLSVETIRAGVLHPDQDVRQAAVRYFADSFSPDPAVMPLAIQAIESLGSQEAFENLEFLADLAQTEETVVWLIDQLERLGDPEDEEEAEPVLAYLSCLAKADPSLLKAHQERIQALSSLDEETAYAVEDRIKFLSQPASELWQELEELCREFDAADEAQSEDIDYANRLVEALGRSPALAADKVLAVLSRATEDADVWLEAFAVRLAGELKLEAAIPHILPLMDDADDWLDDECHRSLVKIGTDAVVRAIKHGYPDGSYQLQLLAAEILGDIHSDASLQTSIELMAGEGDLDIKREFLHAPLKHFAAEGIEPVRQFILERSLDPSVIRIRSALLTACKLMGERFPEFDAWLEDSQNDEERLEKWFEEHPEDLHEENDWDDGDEGYADDDWDEESYQDDEPYEEDDYEEPPPAQPLVLTEPRVGRNDPCPCGSGKKYKKCCYKNRGETAGQDSPWSGSDLPMLTARPKYPLGTVAFYGPDDKTTTKIAAGVIRWEGAEAIMERWVGANIKDNPKVKRQMEQFFKKHAVTTVATSDGNMGCPHEEGPDFPVGEDCPFCPFWKGKQGSARKD